MILIRDCLPEIFLLLAQLELGDIAGTVSKIGYIYISIENKRYLAHRLAWLYTFGRWPNHYIDHINQIKADNRINNLRDVDKSVNSINTPVRSHSLIKEKNIKFDKRDNSYTVLFIRHGITHYLGRFMDLDIAKNVRDRFATTP